MKNIFKKLLISITGLFLLSGCYEQYALYKASKLPLDGKLIEVGNHKIHVVEKGKGDTPVVFEAGWDVTGHMSWEEVQNEIAKQTFTLSYDRAGILRSESSDTPRTCDNISQELYSLLEKEKVKKPYILVGHSLGGILIRCFVKYHKKDVAGIILVDSAHPKQYGEKKELEKLIKKLPSISLVKLESYSGLVRAYSYFNRINIPNIDVNDIRNIKNRAFLPKSYIEYIREGKQFVKDFNEVKGTTLYSIPTTILSAKKDLSKNSNWKKLQKDIAKLSTNSKHSWVESGHYIQLEKPNIVIKAIKEMLKAVNKS